MNNRILVGSALLLFFFGVCVRQGLGLRCWHCNSAFDPRCGEFNFDSSTLETIDCNQMRTEHLMSYEPIYCRKLIQTIRGTKRVVRGCGYLNETKSRPGNCYTRTGTKDIMVTYCHCDKEKCNSANSVMASVGMATLLLALTQLF